MDDKKALLGELTIKNDQRSQAAGYGRWVVTALGALAFALLAWFYLLPRDAVHTVHTEPVTAAGPEGTAGVSSAVLDATGYVTARRQATVSSKLTGKIREVFIEEGMVVEEGQLLAALDDSMQRAAYELASAQFDAAKARLAEAEVSLQEAELNHIRTRALQKKGHAGVADLDRVRLAVDGSRARLAGLEKEVAVAERAIGVQRQQLDDMQIRAPFSGVVIAKAAQPGEMISPVSAGGGFTRTGICTLVDMESLEIEVDVNEAYINRVTPGQKVTAMLNSYPDWPIAAEVITIIPTADRNKATVRVRIRFLEKDSRVLPDMGVRVAFLDATPAEPASAEVASSTGMLVSSASLLRRGEKNIVFVVEDGVVEEREVRPGAATGNKRKVTGLVEGEEVVVSLVGGTLDDLSDGSMVIVR